jgi:thioredoxin reductase
MPHQKLFDVIIIGGSYAGLSAAMSLGRSLRDVLVIDNQEPCNAQTPHSHNFLTHDGSTPSALASVGRQQVEHYKTVTFFKGLAVKGTKGSQGFEIVTQSGDTFESRKLIFASGIKDNLLPIPGFSDCWGISVVHCPYCHGFEFRHERTAILANGEAAMHYALLVSNLTKDLTILTNGPSDFSPEQTQKLAANNIPVIVTAIKKIEHENGHVRNVVFTDDASMSFKAVYAKVPFTQHTDIPASLGCELTEPGFIKVDATQKTTVDGVFACGDNSSMLRAVANAVSTGNFAGAVVNRELATEAFWN